MAIDSMDLLILRSAQNTVHGSLMRFLMDALKERNVQLRTKYPQLRYNHCLSPEMPARYEAA